MTLKVHDFSESTIGSESGQNFTLCLQLLKTNHEVQKSFFLLNRKLLVEQNVTGMIAFESTNIGLNSCLSHLEEVQFLIRSLI
jgi:hypothetical protein